MNLITVRSRGRAERCPACHDVLGSSELLDCQRCEAQIHHDCRELTEACPTLGCGGAFLEVQQTRTPGFSFFQLAAAGLGASIGALIGAAVIAFCAAALILFIAGPAGEGILANIAAGIVGGLAFCTSFLLLLPAGIKYILTNMSPKTPRIAAPR